MSLRKQFDQLTKLRNAAVARMSALSDAAAEGEGRLFTPEEQTEFDKLSGEVKAYNDQLDSLHEAERRMAAVAAPMAAPPGAAPAATPGVEVRAFKPFPGQGFTRYAVALARSKGNIAQAIEIARGWKDQTPEILSILEAQFRSGLTPGQVHDQMTRAAVPPGTTTDPTWAGPLVYAQNLASEFIELLRAETLLDKLPFRAAPFNVRIPRQPSTVGVGWVGQGLSAPAGKFDLDAITLPWAKMVAIIAITDELARFSSPSAEMLARDDLLASMARFMDGDFTDPANAGVANLRPPSLVFGAQAIPSTGNTVAEINTDATALLKYFAANNVPMARPFWLMTPAAKITIGNTRGSTVEFAAWPEIVERGTWFGYPVLTSNSIKSSVGAAAGQTNLILLDASEILRADDGMIDVEASNEASIQLDTVPGSPPTTPVSLWQQGLLGIKAQRYAYWIKRHAPVVAYIENFQT